MIFEISPEEEKNLLEGLAALEHVQWSNWTNYWIDLYDEFVGDAKFYIKYGDLNTSINMDLWVDSLRRWRKQCHTAYNDLSEEDKEKDRKWARLVITILKKESGDSK